MSIYLETAYYVSQMSANDKNQLIIAYIGKVLSKEEMFYLWER